MITRGHGRLVPLMCTVASISRVGHLILHRYIYHEFLQYGVMIDFPSLPSHLIHDPFVYIVAVHVLATSPCFILLFASFLLLPTVSPNIPYWGTLVAFIASKATLLMSRAESYQEQG